MSWPDTLMSLSSCFWTTSWCTPRIVEEHAEHLRKVFAALRKHRLFAKVIKVQHHGQGGGIPQPVGYTTGSLSIEGEIEGSMQLGETSNSQGRQIVSEVCQLLSLLYFEIRRDSSPTNAFDEERCGDAVGSTSVASVPTFKGCPMQCANANLLGS